MTRFFVFVLYAIFCGKTPTAFSRFNNLEQIYVRRSLEAPLRQFVFIAALEAAMAGMLSSCCLLMAKM